jgi:hypothetical protein
LDGKHGNDDTAFDKLGIKDVGKITFSFRKGKKSIFLNAFSRAKEIEATLTTDEESY